MLDVPAVLRDAPHLETFCSVAKLHGLVESLRADTRFEVSLAGSSVNGMPIHHVRFGTGSVKAMFVAFPHCMEPVGGMTVFSLMTLLQQGNRTLLEADVEWHIIPCIDPDGALLNEGWSQNFTLDSYLRNYYFQAPHDAVDNSFPIVHKKLAVDKPSHEAKVLKEILDEVRPDFYLSLHNTRAGGAFYYLSRDIGERYYRDIFKLLEELRFPVEKRPSLKEVFPSFAEGIVELASFRKYYDYLEGLTLHPEKDKLMQSGTHSSEYLLQIKPQALSLIAEMGCLRHPGNESEKRIGGNLRRIKLRVDADSKYLASILLQEWNKVKNELDTANPFYRAIVGGVILTDQEKICEGGFPLSRYPTRDILFNPEYDRTMTEGDLFNVCVFDSGLYFIQLSYQFVRLLQSSRQTSAVLHAVERVERAFDEVRAELGQHIDFDAFEAVDCDTLVKVQLGSGLIVLNSLLERKAGGNQ